MKILCRVSEREFLRLRGKLFPTVILEREHFAVLFEKGKLYLPSQGEHSWRFHFPPILNGPERRLLIEEHPYCGPSKRPDERMVVKSICGMEGKLLDSVMGDTGKYIAGSLATVSLYDGLPQKTVTIKELRASQVDSGHWRLIVWVWRGRRALMDRDSRLRNYLQIVKAAEERLRVRLDKMQKSAAAGPG
jgi:hypothetical protein